MLSSSRYYIRAKGDPSTYWYSNADGLITASRTNSTRFYIRTVSDAFLNQVMINSDPIEMAVDGKTVGISSGGYLEVGGSAVQLTLGSFAGGFKVNNAGGDIIVQEIDGKGIAWELVADGRVNL